MNIISFTVHVIFVWALICLSLTLFEFYRYYYRDKCKGDKFMGDSPSWTAFKYTFGIMFVLYPLVLYMWCYDNIMKWFKKNG